MIFLSALLRQSIYDTADRRIGTLSDICVALNETFPVVTALVIRHSLRESDMIVPWSQVQNIEEPRIRLTVEQGQVSTYTPEANELLLSRDLLDKQIVDTQGFRIVKVNDLKLAQIKHTAWLIGVDISFSGLLRRLGMENSVELLGRVLPIRLSERTITWNYVDPIQVVRAGATGNTGEMTPVLAGAAKASANVGGIVPEVKLNVSHNKLAELHPADIADILEQLDLERAGAVLEGLDTETAADTLNEVEYPRQLELLSELDPERVSDLLEHLSPDDVADILADIPEDKAERLLNLMPAAEAQPIRNLLRYNPETAGGIMTTEVLTLLQDATVEDALAYLRQNSNHLEMVYDLYILDDERHLVGVVSLRQLVTAEPTTHMRDLMETDVIKVQTDTDQEEVAYLISKYDLISIPVVDNNNRLVGIVTVDDVIDVIHEEQAEDFSEIAGANVEEAEEEGRFSWRIAMSRFSWLAVNLVAGFLLALVLYQIVSPLLAVRIAFADMPGFVGVLGATPSRIALNGLICFAPMLLMTSGSAGSQALGVAGWRLRTRHGSDFWQRFFRELGINTVGGVLSTLLVSALTWLLFRSALLSIIVGLCFGFTLLVASICGLVLPNLLQRLRLRGSLITAPLLDPVIAVISLSIFLWITLLFIEQFHV